MPNSHSLQVSSKSSTQGPRSKFVKLSAALLITIVASSSGCGSSESTDDESATNLQESDASAQSSEAQVAEQVEAKTDSPKKMPSLSVVLSQPNLSSPQEIPAVIDGVVRPPTLSLARLEQSAYQVDPNADEEGLLLFLKQMQARQVSNTSHQDRIASIQARIKGAERLLTLASNEQNRSLAIRTKLDSLQMLYLNNSEDEQRVRLVNYCKEVKLDSNPQVAVHGEFLNFAVTAREYLTGGSRDFVRILHDVESMAENNPENAEIFVGIQDLARGLFAVSKVNEGEEILDVIVKKYDRSQNTRIAESVEMLTDRIKLEESGLLQAKRNVLLKQPAAVPTLVDRFTALTKSETLSSTIVTELLLAAQTLETTHHYIEALQAYLFLAKHPSTAKAAAQAAEAKNVEPALAAQKLPDPMTLTNDGITRMQLIGQKIEIDAYTLAGDHLDWNRYQGRVVYLWFWSIEWCQKNPLELQDLKEAYSMYQRLGFEIVGVNMDDAPEIALRFSRDAGMAFVNVRGVEPLAPTTEKTESDSVNPADQGLAKRLGVSISPGSFLVDQTGTVVEAQVYGKSLIEKASNLLVGGIKRR